MPLLTTEAAFCSWIGRETFIHNGVTTVGTTTVGLPPYALFRPRDVAQFNDMAVDNFRIDIDQRVRQRLIRRVSYRAREIAIVLNV